MSKMGEKFTEQQAADYEDRGTNRSEELADLLTIEELSDLIILCSLPDMRDRLRIARLCGLFAEARSVAERNEYAGDYDYPEAAS
jgi:hypothetical protein